MLYAIAFLFLFAIGGLTGIFLGDALHRRAPHDTYFVVAHFHYVMMGGTVIAFLGGLHYWWPKMTGRMYNEKWGRIACALVFIGFNMTFSPSSSWAAAACRAAITTTWISSSRCTPSRPTAPGCSARACS